MTFISRRDLLKRVAGAAAAVPFARAQASGMPAGAPGGSSAPEHSADAERSNAFALQRGEPLENLTAAEMDTVEAVVARLIPSDEHGPGATEARAARYIDRALGGALSASRDAYTAGLAALDRHARASHGAAFRDLPATAQDSVLRDVETGAATEFGGGSAAFFSLLLSHTHQGTFGDPYYGGNANFVGWDLIGYPGVRTMVTPADQKNLEAHQMKPNHRSAYGDDSFTKAAEDRRGR
jgi:gluconate 2-dehydrogenase gamma chain